MRKLLILTFAAFLGGCALNPVTGSPDLVTMTETQEVEAGAQYDVAIRKVYGVYDDPALQAYVNDVGQRLAKISHRKDLKFQFVVLDSSDVNAFALPGGYVYITRGLMSYLNSEAELAAVLGHEIGHVSARHGVRQHAKGVFTQVTMGTVAKSSPWLNNAIGKSALLGGAGAFLASYSRDYELEADGLGGEYLARAGYDPGAILRVLTVLKNQEVFESERAKKEDRTPRSYHGVFASHPSADQRLQETVEEARKKGAGRGETARDSYLDRIDGMVYGDAELEGVLRGRDFYHKDLAFAMRFPDGWRTENTTQALLAFSTDNKAILVFTGATMKEPESAKERLRDVLQTKDLRGARSLDIKGGDGYTVITRAKTPFGYGDVRVSVVVLGNKAYVLRGFTKPDVQRELYDGHFIDAAQSIRKLAPTDMKLAEPLRIRLYTPAPADTYKTLGAKTPVSGYPESILRLINQQYPEGEIKPGARIKLVR